MSKTIITISRQYGSGGREIGRKISELLGIPLYDKELIEDASKTTHIDREFFKNSDDIDPTNLYVGTSSLLYHLSLGLSQQPSLHDKVFIHQSETIREIAKKGSCIFVGRCADYILKDYDNLLKVFIYADTESRKQRIVNEYHEPAQNAAQILNRIDKRRAAYYNFYTNQKFGDIKNYNICLDSSAVDLYTCASIIEKAYLAREKQNV